MVGTTEWNNVCIRHVHNLLRDPISVSTSDNEMVDPRFGKFGNKCGSTRAVPNVENSELVLFQNLMKSMHIPMLRPSVQLATKSVHGRAHMFTICRHTTVHVSTDQEMIPLRHTRYGRIQNIPKVRSLFVSTGTSIITVLIAANDITGPVHKTEAKVQQTTHDPFSKAYVVHGAKAIFDQDQKSVRPICSSA